MLLHLRQSLRWVAKLRAGSGAGSPLDVKLLLRVMLLLLVSCLDNSRIEMPRDHSIKTIHLLLRALRVDWGKRVMECSFDTELGRIVLSQHVLDFRLVVLAFIGHLLSDLAPPICEQLEGLLPDLFYEMQVEIMLTDHKT